MSPISDCHTCPSAPATEPIRNEQDVEIVVAPDIGNAKKEGPEALIKGPFSAILITRPEPNDVSWMGSQTAAELKFAFGEDDSWRFALRDSLQRFPAFMANQFFNAVPSVLVASGAVLINGLISRAQVASLGSWEGKTFKDVEMDLVAPLWISYLFLVTQYMYMFFCGWIFFIMMRNMWNHRVYFHWKRTVLVQVLVCMSLMIVKLPLMRALGDRRIILIDKAFFFFYLVSALVLVSVFFIRVTRDVGQKWIGFVSAYIFIILIAVYAFYRYNIQKILAGSTPDWARSVLVCLFNPIVMQLFTLLPSRLLARATWHNHPSSKWSFVGMNLVFEKAIGRLVMSGMKDFYWVAFCSLFSGAGAALVALALGRRDKHIYSLIGRWFPTADAHRQCDHERNSMLQCHIWTFNWVADVTMICASTTMIFAYGITTDKAMPSVAFQLSSAAMQIVGTILVSLATVSYAVVKNKEDMISIARHRCANWPVVSMIICSQCVMMIGSSMLPFMLCGVDTRTGGVWEICLR